MSSLPRLSFGSHSSHNRSHKDAQLITDAHSSPREDWHRRRRTYLLLQFSRIPLITASLIAWMLSNNLWLTGILAFISVPLPWIAVLIANNVGEAPDKRAPKVYKPQLLREHYQRDKELSSALSDSIPTIDHDYIDHD